MKPNVLIATDFYYPHWTGISKSLFNLTKILKNDISFTVLTVQHDKKLLQEEVIEGTHIIREPYIFTFSRAKYAVSIVERAFQEIPKHDTVLINSPNTNVLFIAILAKLLRKKLIIFHQGDLILPDRSIVSRCIEFVFDTMTRFAMSLADGVSTYSSDYAAHSRVLGDFQYKCTPHIMPVLLSDKPDLTSPKLKHLHSAKKKNMFIFGFAGRFVSEKGFDTLFKALAQIKTKKPFICAFAGETQMGYENTFAEQKELLDSVSENVCMLGLLNDDELAAYYSMIDVFILPSRSECFGLVQAEAAQLKKPLIVADIPGARVLVKKSGFGTLFPSENATALARAMESILENPHQFDHNYKVALQMIDPHTNAKQIADYITK